MSNELAIFKSKSIRRQYDEEKEIWYFSVVDVISILTDSVDGRKYWSVLKTRLKKEGNQLTTNCSQLKMKSEDGKMDIYRQLYLSLQFYKIFPNTNTMCSQLNWSQYKLYKELKEIEK